MGKEACTQHRPPHVCHLNGDGPDRRLIPSYASFISIFKTKSIAKSINKTTFSIKKEAKSVKLCDTYAPHTLHFEPRRAKEQSLGCHKGGCVRK